MSRQRGKRADGFFAIERAGGLRTTFLTLEVRRRSICIQAVSVL